MGDRLVITLPCDLRYRNAVGALIQQICQGLERDGAAAGLGFQVVSAFNEAFNNLVQYANEDERAPVEVVVEVGGDNLVIELTDRGKSYAFDTVETPDLGDLPESGLGIFIIRSFMTEVSYKPGDAGQPNILRMVRQLRTPTGSGAPEPPEGTSDNA